MYWSKVKISAAVGHPGVQLGKSLVTMMGMQVTYLGCGPRNLQNWNQLAGKSSQQISHSQGNYRHEQLKLHPGTLQVSISQ